MKPHIQDRDGRELFEGAKVERNINGVAGGIVGEVLALTKLDVLVQWPGAQRFYKPERHPLLRNTYCVPALQLIDPQEEAVDTAVSERSTA